MKILFLIFGLIGASCSAKEQDSSKTDLWSGTYAVRLVAKDSSAPVGTTVGTPVETLIIERSKSDPDRWIGLDGEDGTDNVIIEEFSFDPEGEEDDYEEFGWTELHREGKMNCIDGGHFFICQTQPNTTVKLWKESFFSRTGIFGLMLHRGLFEIERIAPERR